MEIKLTDAEETVLQDLAEKFDIPEDRVLIRGLRVLQLIQRGYADLIYPETDAKLNINGIEIG